MNTPSKVLLVLAGVALAVVGIIALFYGWVDYHGAHVWEQTRRHLQALGDPIDPAAAVPAPVPDQDQNLAFAPIFARIYQYRGDAPRGCQRFDRTDDEAFRQAITALPYGLESDKQATLPHFDTLNWDSGHPFDLDALARYYRRRQDFPHAPAARSPAADILLALTRFGPVLDEVAQAAARPKTCFPADWTIRARLNDTFSYYTPLMVWIETLSLRACASLAQGDTDAALRDLRVCRRLRDATVGEPVLLNWNYDYYNLNYLLQPAWEGLAARRWSAAQLTELQTLLGGIDSIAERRQRLRGKRSISLTAFAADVTKPAGFRLMFSNLGGAYRNPTFLNVMARLLPLLPHGWFDEAVSRYAEAEQTYLLDALHVGAHRVNARLVEDSWRLTYRAPPVPANFLVKFYLGTHYWAILHAASAQAGVDQALVACALERYFLDHQTYPAALAALVPAYLPRAPLDLMDGAPMRYRLTTAGRYRLWSVGWDGRDDNGRSEWSTEAKHRRAPETGDWSWQYEPVPPPS